MDDSAPSAPDRDRDPAQPPATHPAPDTRSRGPPAPSPAHPDYRRREPHARTDSPSAPHPPAPDAHPRHAAPPPDPNAARPMRPWSQSPPPGRYPHQPYPYPSPDQHPDGRGPDVDMDTPASGAGLSPPYDHSLGRRHSIASGEIGHHNSHSHPNARGPPSNSAHLLSPYHDQQYPPPPQHYPRESMKRKLSHDRLPSGGDPFANSNSPGSGQYANSSTMDVEEGNPSKRRGSAVDSSRMAQMSIHDRDAPPPPPLWGQQHPRWPPPYPPHPPPPHIADERRDSAASIFSSTSMGSSVSGYTPSTAPTSFNSNAGPPGDPKDQFQGFVWPPPHHGPPYPPPPPNFPPQMHPHPGNFNFSPHQPPPPSATERSRQSSNDSPPRTSDTPGNAATSDNANASQPSSSQKDTPYSRSPELRVSHKLAERKRRKEMKDLFDELRDQLPADRGMKASKWEILSKAVEYIASMKTLIKDQARELEMLRHEVEGVRGPGGGPPTMAASGHHQHPGGPHHMMQMQPSHFGYRAPGPGVGPPPAFGRNGTPPQQSREREGQKDVD